MSKPTVTVLSAFLLFVSSALAQTPVAPVVSVVAQVYQGNQVVTSNTYALAAAHCDLPAIPATQEVAHNPTLIAFVDPTDLSRSCELDQTAVFAALPPLGSGLTYLVILKFGYGLDQFTTATSSNPFDFPSVAPGCTFNGTVYPINAVLVQNVPNYTVASTLVHTLDPLGWRPINYKPNPNGGYDITFRCAGA